MEQLGISTILGLLGRHALTMLGGAAIAKGWADADTVSQVVGAIASVGAVWWSGLQKRSQVVQKLG